MQVANAMSDHLISDMLPIPPEAGDPVAIAAQPEKAWSHKWRYSVATEFEDPDGASAKWAPGQPQELGAEQSYAPLRYAMIASLNADSSLLAVAQANEVMIYDTVKLELQHVLRSRKDTGSLWGVQFHPQRPLELASCLWKRSVMNSTISLWNLALETTSMETEVFPGHMSRSFYDKRGERLLFHVESRVPEGDLLEIFVRDAQSGSAPHKVDYHFESIRWLAFGEPSITANADGSCDSIGSSSWDGTFRIFNARTLQRQRVLRTGVQNDQGHFSPDGKYFVGCVYRGFGVHIWDLQTGSKIKCLALETLECNTVAFGSSPTGNHLILGGAGAITIMDMASWSIRRSRTLIRGKDVARHASLFGSVRNLRSNRVSGHDESPGMIGWQLGGDGGLELYDMSRNRKWRYAAADAQARAGAVSWFWLDGRKTLLVVNGDGIRKWAFTGVPSE